MHTGALPVTGWSCLPGTSWVLFPNDAHRIKMQLNQPETVSKVVFKVRIFDD